MGLQPNTSVLLYSADNPEATYLVAALLRHRSPQVGPLATRNLGDAVPGRGVAVALAELGCSPAVWPAALAEVAPSPFDLGITLCVPTWDTWPLVRDAGRRLVWCIEDPRLVGDDAAYRRVGAALLQLMADEIEKGG